MNDSFVFHRVFYESLKGLSPDTFKCCMMALCKYALDGEEPEGAIEKAFVTLAKPYFNVEIQREMATEAEIWHQIMWEQENE